MTAGAKIAQVTKTGQPMIIVHQEHERCEPMVRDELACLRIDLAAAHHMNPLAWDSPDVLLPNLRRLTQAQGLALGAPGRGPIIAASGPQFISLPGYLEI